VVQGHGRVRARETGGGTALGRIGKALEAVVPEQTPLQAETRQVVRLLAISGIVLCAVLADAYGLTRGHWLDDLLASLTLAMAIIPNEFRLRTTTTSLLVHHAVTSSGSRRTGVARDAETRQPRSLFCRTASARSRSVPGPIVSRGRSTISVNRVTPS
jgi:hypothetical protein